MSRRQEIGRTGGEGDVATPLWSAEPLVAWLLRANGSFPLKASPGERAHGVARRPGRPGGAAIPSSSRAGAAGRARRHGRGKR
jgi:hypothetical protein